MIASHRSNTRLLQEAISYSHSATKLNDTYSIFALKYRAAAHGRAYGFFGAVAAQATKWCDSPHLTAHMRRKPLLLSLSGGVCCWRLKASGPIGANIEVH